DTSVKKVVNVNRKDLSVDTIVIKKDFKKMIYTDENGKKIDIIGMENGNIAYAVQIDELSLDDVPLYVLDGKIMSYKKINEIHPKEIESMTVLKDKSATEKYGSKGKYGVIEINSKPFDENEIVEVLNINSSNIVYKSKNGRTAFISKGSSDDVLNANKANLKLLDVEVNYSKIKRNKSGEIVGIKIILKDDNGQKATASYEDSNGISDIRYGIIEGKLIISSAN